MAATHRKTTALGRGGGRKVRVLGEVVAYKVTADMTGGAYSMFEVAVPPGDGPPLHVQHHEDECFYVLEGEFEFLADGGTAKAGSLVYIPKGSLHTYKNVGGVPGRLLAIHTPGGVHESFFEEIGEEEDEEKPSAANLPPDIGKIIAVAARHGIEVPPPSAG